MNLLSQGYIYIERQLKNQLQSNKIEYVPLLHTICIYPWSSLDILKPVFSIFIFIFKKRLNMTFSGLKDTTKFGSTFLRMLNSFFISTRMRMFSWNYSFVAEYHQLLMGSRLISSRVIDQKNAFLSLSNIKV